MILGCTPVGNTLDFSDFEFVEMPMMKLGWKTDSGAEFFQDTSRHLIFTAQGRVDNTVELQSFTGTCSSSAEYIWKAFLAFGKKCVTRIVGDWFFVAYDTLSGELFMGRDQYGKGELFYRVTRDGFWLSSSIQALVNAFPQSLNPLFVIRTLYLWQYRNAEKETIFKDIFTLPPGHTLTFKEGKIKTQRYWFPENIRLKYYADTRDYADELLVLTKEAIRCRIPENRAMATMLSGGFDSGTVSLLTAEIFGEVPLTTFSHVPLYDRYHHSYRNKINDESGHIDAIASSVKNIRSFKLKSGHISPIDGIEKFVHRYNTMIPGAINAFWLMDINEQAEAIGAEVLFSGGTGNAALSYRGLAMMSGFDALKHRVIKPALRNIKCYRWFMKTSRSSFITKELLNEYPIKYDMLLHGTGLHSAFRTAQEEMLILIHKTTKGRLDDSTHKIRKLDPTADIRIIEHCMAIPNHFFFNKKGEDKQVIRRMMAGRLPDMVLHEKRKGLQSSDVFLRVKAEIDRVEEYCIRFEKNPTFRYFIDTQKFKEAVSIVRNQEIEDRTVVGNILSSIMLGVFLEQNNF